MDGMDDLRDLAAKAGESWKKIWKTILKIFFLLNFIMFGYVTVPFWQYFIFKEPATKVVVVILDIKSYELRTFVEFYVGLIGPIISIIKILK